MGVFLIRKWHYIMQIYFENSSTSDKINVRWRVWLKVDSKRIR